MLLGKSLLITLQNENQPFQKGRVFTLSKIYAGTSILMKPAAVLNYRFIIQRWMNKAYPLALISKKKYGFSFSPS